MKIKGLRLFLSPFTPDQSGAESVFFGYNCMTVMLDAGGCIGNTCGFDEPRWKKKPGSVFSAALRDIDAILGSDEILIDKVRKAYEITKGDFISIIGTPITAVIGVDYKAMARLLENRLGIPVVSISTNGMELYDKGIEKAYMELLRKFAPKSNKKERIVDNNSIGLIGALPLDMYSENKEEMLDFIKKVNTVNDKEPEIYTYGYGSLENDILKYYEISKNIVISPAGIKSAKFMKSEYGIPYEAYYPLDKKLRDILKEKIRNSGINKLDKPKILVIHQQFFANAVRDLIREEMNYDNISVSTWFMLIDEYSKEGDQRLIEEGDLASLVDSENYNVIIGDPLLQMLIAENEALFIPLPHFAISGELHELKEYD